MEASTLQPEQDLNLRPTALPTELPGNCYYKESRRISPAALPRTLFADIVYLPQPLRFFWIIGIASFRSYPTCFAPTKIITVPLLITYCDELRAGFVESLDETIAHRLR